MKTKDINKIIIEILSIVLFLTPLLIYPRDLIADYNKPKVIVLYMSGISLLAMLFIKRKEIKLDKKDILIFMFWLWSIVSVFFSINIKTSLFGEYGRYEGFFIISTYILIYYFSKYYFKEYKNFHKILFGIATGISAYSILQFYDIRPIYSWLGVDYTKYWNSATLGNPNFLASYITIFLPIFMSLFILKGKKKYLIISTIVFWAMLCTLTRSAWVAFAVYFSILIIYLIHKKQKSFTLNGSILIISFIFIFVLGNFLSGGRILNKNLETYEKIKDVVGIYLKNDDVIQAKKIDETYQIKSMIKVDKGINTTNKPDNIAKNIKISKVENNTNEELINISLKQKLLNARIATGRFDIWIRIINIIKMHPITGCGIDTIKDVIMVEQQDYFLERALEHGGYVDKAHNEYLQIAATMGIPAIIIYLLFIFFIIKDNMKYMFKNKIRLIISLSIIGYLVQAIFNISTIGVAPIFWFLLGLIQNNEYIKRNDF